MKEKNIKIIRAWLLFFMLSLFCSGLTAIPIDNELQWLLQATPTTSVWYGWLQKVLSAYMQTKARFPFLLYGYDWLAFAHFVLAILFMGPYRDPVKNKWVLQFGLIACVLVVPFAFVAGYYRGIPPGWQLIDCSFGILGSIPLYICYKKIQSIEFQTS